MFAALNTVEPPIFDLPSSMIFDRDEPWYEQRMQSLEDSVRTRLDQLHAASAMPTGSTAHSAPAT